MSRELWADKLSDEIQPRYRAYMDAYGYSEIPKGNQGEFLIWCSSMWRQSGIDSHMEGAHERFDAWLLRRLAGPLPKDDELVGVPEKESSE